LDALHIGAEDGNSFIEQLSIQQSWVGMMKKKIEVINHTPKSLTRITPLEAHFPETIGKTTKMDVVNEKHMEILNEQNQNVRVFILYYFLNYVFKKILSLNICFIIMQIIVPEKEEVIRTISEKQKRNADKYIEKSQRTFLSVKGTKRIFKVGDKVLVNKSLRTQKKKTLGKGYFPYSGEVTQVKKDGDYYFVKWGVMHPSNVEEGEESKRALRWDQLIPIEESQETTELVLQHFRQADSYNTSEIEPEIKELKRILRQKIGENGDLEVLCQLQAEKLLVWRRVADVGRSKQYQDFMEDFEYWENLRKEGRKEEEKKGDLYEIEEFICKKEGEVLVLWENWNEPTWVSVRRVCHLEEYKRWREGNTFQEISEKDEIIICEGEESEDLKEENMEETGSEKESEEEDEEEIEEESE